MSKRHGIYPTLVKRAIDIVFSGLLLVVLSPVMVALAILVRRNMGSPVLFRQPRGGRDGQVFLLNKFRSMRDAVDRHGDPLPDDKRLTPLGNTMRRLSLDELPQLWNVFRGDMSLVGPRPLLVEYLDRYTERQARRHEVRPGITGWAQVNGRNAISWDEKFEFDIWYVDNLSAWVDTIILVRTVGRVVRPTDINASGHSTMPKFWGTVDRDPDAGTSKQ
ncbi:MAG: sugar transferase [Planctomycetota bacterium]|nr:sugar transferase [Planctomycetota bacterium]MDA1180477.1 sugar transferase [Planctomycetota bacterium]